MRRIHQSFCRHFLLSLTYSENCESSRFIIPQDFNSAYRASLQSFFTFLLLIILLFFGAVSDNDSLDVVNTIQKDDLIESIEIAGELKEDAETKESLDEWNKVIDTIML